MDTTATLIGHEDTERHAIFLKIQEALNGHEPFEALKAIADSLAILIGFMSEDNADAAEWLESATKGMAASVTANWENSRTMRRIAAEQEDARGTTH